eukprot:GILK01008268.1.p1 GENE.GILK01008268.1~~GILK01008268.1.p1  ORF type:complete len:1078 (-),score=217.08 GILK01008268.1:37-2844(-)
MASSVVSESTEPPAPASAATVTEAISTDTGRYRQAPDDASVSQQDTTPPRHMSVGAQLLRALVDRNSTVTTASTQQAPKFRSPADMISVDDTPAQTVALPVANSKRPSHSRIPTGFVSDALPEDIKQSPIGAPVNTVTSTGPLAALLQQRAKRPLGAGGAMTVSDVESKSMYSLHPRAGAAHSSTGFATSRSSIVPNVTSIITTPAPALSTASTVSTAGEDMKSSSHGVGAMQHLHLPSSPSSVSKSIAELAAHRGGLSPSSPSKRSSYRASTDRSRNSVNMYFKHLRRVSNVKAAIAAGVDPTLLDDAAQSSDVNMASEANVVLPPSPHAPQTIRVEVPEDDRVIRSIEEEEDVDDFEHDVMSSESEEESETAKQDEKILKDIGLQQPLTSPTGSGKLSVGTVDPRKSNFGSVDDLLEGEDLIRFDEPDQEGVNIVYAQSVDGEAAKMIKCATVVKLIEKLTSPVNDMGMQFRFCFLLTYRSFIKPIQLLRLLVKRYQQEEETQQEASDSMGSTKDPLSPERLQRSAKKVEAVLGKITKPRLLPVQLKVLSVLKYWVQHHYHDFESDAMLKRHLLEVIETVLLPSNKTFADQLTQLLTRLGDGETKLGASHVPTSCPDPIIPANASAQFNIMEWHPTEIARQLTLQDFELFRSIHPKELIKTAWSKKDKAVKAPNVLSLIERFNGLSRWIAEEVLRGETARERLKIIKHFLKIAEKCRELHNYNTLFTIVSGLKSSPVFRLKQTWELLSARKKNRWEKLQLLCASDKGWKRIRDEFRAAVPPVMPYLGIFLTDLTFIEENKDMIDNMVNFHKLRLISGVINQIKEAQQTPYQFHTVMKLQRLRQVTASHDDILYEISLQREPKKGISSAMMTARLESTQLRISSSSVSKALLQNALAIDNGPAPSSETGSTSDKHVPTKSRQDLSKILTSHFSA